MQSAVVASKLANAWAGLSGRVCPLVAASCLPSLRPDDACFSLPISDRVAGLAGRPRALVLVMLGQTEAFALAAAMFGVAVEQLQPADVQDAGMELCNILSACLLQCLGDTNLSSQSSQSSLGLPERLSQPQWQVFSRSGETRALFVCADRAQRLAVMLTDIQALAEAALPGEKRPPSGLSSEN